MIYDLLSNAPLYHGVSPRLKLALEFLQTADFSALPDGHIAIDGDAVFANLSHGTTLPEVQTAEAHDRYLDIQYLIEGHELIGIAPRSTLTEVESHPERDIRFYRGRFDFLPLGDARFIVLWPHDAHAPGKSVPGLPSATRKCVLKVLF